MPCGAETQDGGECSRPEGWGTDADEGPCRSHRSGTSGTTARDGPPDLARQRVLKELEQGATYKQAAAAAGIHRDTLLRWRREDPDFADQCERRRHQVDREVITTIVDAARSGDVSAAIWWAEHIVQPGQGLDLDEVRPLVDAIRDVAYQMLDEETAGELIERVGDEVVDATG